jgi:hypothetical protein
MRVFLPSTLPALAAVLKAGQLGPGARSGQSGLDGLDGRDSRDSLDSRDSRDSLADLGPAVGFAVTPSLREAYASGDEEELEYSALTEAARASLRLLAADPAAPLRRVVLAVELPAEQVRWDPRDRRADQDLVGAPVPLARLESALVDAPEAAPDVRDAVEALPAADAGDDDAKFAVDGAEGHELGWYAAQELPYLAE